MITPKLKFELDSKRDGFLRVKGQDGLTVYTLILQGEDLLIECSNGSAILALPESSNRIHVREINELLFQALRQTA
jgi:hypothetical protein